MTDVGPKAWRTFVSVDAGIIGQSVYRYCASEGLIYISTVFRCAGHICSRKKIILIETFA